MPYKKRRRTPHSDKKHVSKTVKEQKREHSTEELIPVKDIRNGIVELTDGRYIKILEVEPINFLLRSVREQKGIIYSFASWLKISPVKIQIKVLTKKADISKHLNAIERDMERERDPKCRELQQDYSKHTHYNKLKNTKSIYHEPAWKQIADGQAFAMGQQVVSTVLTLNAGKPLSARE